MSRGYPTLADLSPRQRAEAEAQLGIKAEVAAIATEMGVSGFQTLKAIADAIKAVSSPSRGSVVAKKRISKPRPISNANNPHPHSPSAGTEPERDPCGRVPAALPSEARHPGKHLVRVTSFRRRLLDPDNLCPKFHIDTLRYAGCIPGDSPAEIEITTGQAKVARKEDERTVIEITIPDPRYGLPSDEKPRGVSEGVEPGSLRLGPRNPGRSAPVPQEIPNT